jgi:hypothetical protein
LLFRSAKEPPSHFLPAPSSLLKSVFQLARSSVKVLRACASSVASVWVWDEQKAFLIYPREFLFFFLSTK